MSKVKYELNDGVALITLNDPGTLNSMDTTMADAVRELVVRSGGEARCVVLTGEGRAFCSGANLSPPSERATGADGQIDAGERLEKHFNPLARALRGLPVPFVTAVNGLAAGVGASFALMGDLIVAGEGAYFLQAFRRIGLVPDGGSTYLLPRLVGRARAMEMMLLGEKLPAPKALEWGLINRCVPDLEVLATAKALALELARGPASLGLIRNLVWDSLDATYDEQLDRERDNQRRAGRTNDFIEGVTAFLQKRPANFKGS